MNQIRFDTGLEIEATKFSEEIKKINQSNEEERYWLTLYDEMVLWVDSKSLFVIFFNGWSSSWSNMEKSPKVHIALP